MRIKAQSDLDQQKIKDDQKIKELYDQLVKLIESKQDFKSVALSMVDEIGKATTKYLRDPSAVMILKIASILKMNLKAGHPNAMMAKHIYALYTEFHTREELFNTLLKKSLGHSPEEATAYLRSLLAPPAVDKAVKENENMSTINWNFIFIEIHYDMKLDFDDGLYLKTEQKITNETQCDEYIANLKRAGFTEVDKITSQMTYKEKRVSVYTIEIRDPHLISKLKSKITTFKQEKLKILQSLPEAKKYSVEVKTLTDIGTSILSELNEKYLTAQCVKVFDGTVFKPNHENRSKHAKIVQITILFMKHISTILEKQKKTKNASETPYEQSFRQAVNNCALAKFIGLCDESTMAYMVLLELFRKKVFPIEMVYIVGRKESAKNQYLIVINRDQKTPLEKMSQWNKTAVIIEPTLCVCLPLDEFRANKMVLAYQDSLNGEKLKKRWQVKLQLQISEENRDIVLRFESDIDRLFAEARNSLTPELTALLEDLPIESAEKISAQLRKEAFNPKVTLEQFKMTVEKAKKYGVIDLKGITTPRSALHWAAQAGNIEKVHALLEAGSNPLLKDDKANKDVLGFWEMSKQPKEICEKVLSQFRAQSREQQKSTLAKSMEKVLGTQEREDLLVALSEQKDVEIPKDVDPKVV